LGSIALPVIAGFAVGFALILILSSTFKPSLELSDEQFKARLKIIPEVKAFQVKAAEYHIQPTEIMEERDENSMYMLYVSVNQYHYNEGDPTTLKGLTIAKELRLHVGLHSNGDRSIQWKCVKNYPNDLQVQDLNATLKEIRNSTCLELGDISSIHK
jgi:hypothetical protein